MEQLVLDACCGSRMFWFDRTNPDAIYVDKRRERHQLKDKSSKGGSRALVVDPDVQADFTCLLRCGRNGWLAKKYGQLFADWREELTAGFAECFRVLKTDGTLVFKWNQRDIQLAKVLELTPHKPLFGNQHGKGSHWLVFMKPPLTPLRRGG